ncbi:TonB-dependent receptor [Marinifilum fragile]|uniref:SusC/RagA family TonB-linked outer membrane protein n=1 Tax=Marinifilum fragile TaxID=570161 RepID=UPI002AA69CDD|nr:TonB-dependent receptor [Marinifilum fragile]
MKKSLVSMLILFFIGLQSILAQSREVTGVVTSAEDGLSIPGVSVIVKGTTIGTSTDFDGKYSINVPDGENVLVFSFVGMTTQELTVTSSTLNVAMENESIGVEEVMVVAYGTAKKSTFTGSAAVVKKEALENLQVSSVTKALQGNAPGVQVISSSGQPGENPTIRIRGTGSINASSSPLYVVDGAPFDGNISSINPDDIETMTVLKDAAAASLYGSRAANGVVIIKTKSGKSGKTKISFKLQHGFSTRAVEGYDFVRGDEYYKLYWEGLRNGAISDPKSMAGYASAEAYATDNVVKQLVYNPFNVDKPIGLDGQIVDGAKLLYNADWQDALSQTAKRTDAGLSVSGGNEKTQFFLSGGYLKDEGIALESDFERFSSRVSVTTKAKEWLKTGISANMSRTEQNAPTSSGNSYRNIFLFENVPASIYPVYERDSEGNIVYENGKKKFDYGKDRPMGAADNSNPVASTTMDIIKNTRTSVGMNAFAEAKFLEDFTFKTNLRSDYYVRSYEAYYNSEFGDGAGYNGRSSKRKYETYSWTFTNTLNWNKTFNEDHTFGVLLGTEAYSYNYQSLEGQKTQFPFNGVTELAVGAQVSDLTSGTYDHRIVGYFSQFNYDFRNRYYVSASYRRDGSTKFHKDSRWGSFWSVSGSWRIDQENFLNDVDWLSSLKIRGSYGTSGNDGILDAGGYTDYFPYLGLYETGYNDLANAGIILASLPNYDLKWESNAQANIAIEFGFLDQRINGSIELYERKSKDLLFARPMALSTGFTSVNENIGDVKNTGIEFVINTVNIDNDDFHWETSFNIAANKNEVTKLPQEEIEFTYKKYKAGKSIYDFFIRDYAGVDPLDGAAMWYTMNDEGEKVTTKDYDSADKFYVGSAEPDFIGGITNNFRYKNFDLSFMFNFSVGGKVYDGSYAGLMHAGTNVGKQMHKDMLNRWQKEGDVTDVPRLDNSDGTNYNAVSTRFLYDNDYLRLRNITLGYTLPNSLLEKVNLSRARVYVQADNLFTFVKHEGMDPEQSTSGVTDNRYPALKTVSFGVKVDF